MRSIFTTILIWGVATIGISLVGFYATSRLLDDRHPRRPDKVPAIRITFGLRNAPESWRDYVYWNVELDDA